MQIECHLWISYSWGGLHWTFHLLLKEARSKILIIITCALTRAVWLGVTKTMEVDEFKDKLNQFISNCVRPAETISDNAKTFGAMANRIKKIRKK